MDSNSASQGVQGCPSLGMAERGEGSGTEMVVVTVVTDCRQCQERLVSKVVDLNT